jgi:hypothetical protein
MSSNETTTANFEDQAAILKMNDLFQRVQWFLRNRTTDALEWPGCSPGTSWDAERYACVKDSERVVLSGDHHGGGISSAGKVNYYVPLAVFFLAFCLAAVFIVLRFYIEYLIYVLNARRVRRESNRNHHLDQLESSHSLAASASRGGFTMRNPFGGSVESLPPPYPGVGSSPSSTSSGFKILERPPSYEESQQVAP